MLRPEKLSPATWELLWHLGGHSQQQEGIQQGCGGAGMGERTLRGRQSWGASPRNHMPYVWCEGSFFWGERSYFASASQRVVRNQGKREQSKRGNPKLRDTTPHRSSKSIKSPRVQFELWHSLEQVTFFPLSFPICKMKASQQTWRLWPSWRRRKVHKLEMGDRMENTAECCGQGGR